MPKFKVKENNEIQYGIKRDPVTRHVIERTKTAKAGDVIELSHEEALALSHALENVKGADEEKGGKK